MNYKNVHDLQYQTIAEREMINKFMGWDEDGISGMNQIATNVWGDVAPDDEENPFEYSFELLMPVVSKIYDWYLQDTKKHYYSFTDACGGIEDFKHRMFKADIEQIYPLVSKFIKWYNENK